MCEELRTDFPPGARQVPLPERSDKNALPKGGAGFAAITDRLIVFSDVTAIHSTSVSRLARPSRLRSGSCLEAGRLDFRRRRKSLKHLKC